MPLNRFLQHFYNDVYRYSPEKVDAAFQYPGSGEQSYAHLILRTSGGNLPPRHAPVRARRTP